jgi:hypothetical protein
MTQMTAIPTNEASATAIQQDGWLNLSQVAAYLGVSKKSVSRSNIPRTYVGRLPRFHRSIVDKALFEGLVKPSAPELDMRVKAAAVRIETAHRQSANRHTDAKLNRRQRFQRLLSGEG